MSTDFEVMSVRDAVRAHEDLSDPNGKYRQMAQTDPAPKLVTRWGEVTEQARRHLLALTASLRELDLLREQLGERDITVDINLGPIGNAAAAARRDVERRNERPAFRMPETFAGSS